MKKDEKRTLIISIISLVVGVLVIVFGVIWGVYYYNTKDNVETYIAGIDSESNTPEDTVIADIPDIATVESYYTQILKLGADIDWTNQTDKEKAHTLLNFLLEYLVWSEVGYTEAFKQYGDAIPASDITTELERSQLAIDGIDVMSMYINNLMHYANGKGYDQATIEVFQALEDYWISYRTLIDNYHAELDSSTSKFSLDKVKEQFKQLADRGKELASQIDTLKS